MASLAMENNQLDLVADALYRELISTNLADITMAAPDDSELAMAVAEALETAEAPSDGRDCLICLQEDVDDEDGTAAWKETPCGHRFHGRCVERWLRAKGSCPMCRRQVVAMPAVTASSITSYERLEIERSVIHEYYGEVVVNSTFIEEEELLN